MAAVNIIHTGRLFSLTNAYQLAATGSWAHRYSRIFGNFRLCHWALINLSIIHGLYWCCLWMHYQHNDQIHLLCYFSALLHDCIYAHLFVGVFTYAVVAFEYRKYVAFSRHLVGVINDSAAFAQRQRDMEASTDCDVSPLWWRRPLQWMQLRCSGLEWFVYYKMWMNTVVLLTLAVYNLCRIDLRQLTGTRIMLIIGLAYPHLLVANVLRYYTVHAMAVNALWTTENDQLVAGTETMARSNKPAHITLDAFAEPVQPAATTSAHQFGTHFANIGRYQQLYAGLNRLVQCQLGLLLKKNALIVFIAVHVYVKVRLLWHAVLTDMDLHLMRVNLVTFVAMMMNDYVCLLVVSQVCQREVRYAC